MHNTIWSVVVKLVLHFVDMDTYAFKLGLRVVKGKFVQLGSMILRDFVDHAKKMKGI